MPFSTRTKLKDLLPPAQINPNPRPQTQMTLMDTLVHKMKGLANPATGRVQHWANDPIQQANSQLMLGGPMGMAHVYHGSPHKFTKFRMDKIGTGEGAQAYGHGLYFADNPKTAQAYQKALAPGRGADLSDVAARVLEEAGGDKAKAINEVRYRKSLALRRKPAYLSGSLEDSMKHFDGVMDAIKSGKAESNLYKVDLPDEAISKMIDFDKPYRRQPKVVKDIFKEAGWSSESFVGPNSLHNQPTPEKLVGLLERRYGPKSAAEYLKKKGITGIKYLDQASRKTGKGSYNYVVFDDKLPKILEMNNLPVEDLPFAKK